MMPGASQPFVEAVESGGGPDVAPVDAVLGERLLDAGDRGQRVAVSSGSPSGNPAAHTS